MEKNKAIMLLSGGLDSILAAKLVSEQKIELEALNFVTVFCTCTSRDSSCLASKAAAEQLGIPLKVMNVSSEYLDVVKKPKHGYGSNMNPCIDCRIFMFRRAKKYMQDKGAKFIVTGEVLGERPMSQRRDTMRLIEKEAGLDGLILRPLSAKSLTPTIPEEKGWVDRNKLLDIKGRSRKPQIALAQELNIVDYPCPAGGCLLTDPGFAKRIKDLIAHEQLDLDNVKLLKLGRHFRLSGQTKAVIGRNEAENKQLLNIAKDDDILFDATDFPSPIGLLRGKSGNGPFDGVYPERSRRAQDHPERPIRRALRVVPPAPSVNEGSEVEGRKSRDGFIELAASIVARYSDSRDSQPMNIDYFSIKSCRKKFVLVKPIEETHLESMRI